MISFRSFCLFKPHKSNEIRWDVIQCLKGKDGDMGLGHFRLSEKLGFGDIGSVYLAELRGICCLFAMKRQSSKQFSEQAARFYASEALLAIEYLHMTGVVYRDLKPGTFLVRKDGHIMLSHFDLSLRCYLIAALVLSWSILLCYQSIVGIVALSNLLFSSDWHVDVDTGFITVNALAMKRFCVNVVAFLQDAYIMFFTGC
ncbi:hypothetical protein F0562_004711 [Nyssa sinensis]|uniref:non-specific serine/threonine protein kinase n=1 Tax=Nyssa sinensis TaxID=561372 RepID=A0A5J5BYL0_9ASTE|nr:hypothetical protein F0562_004711 [Nyssa sinensis]